MKIFMKLVYQIMVIFSNFSPTTSHFHLLQVGNCGSNSRLVVDEDDNGKLRPERVKGVVNWQNTRDNVVPRMQQWPLDIPQ